MQQVIINVGVSGAGKSTWSTAHIFTNYNVVRINRDAIRTLYMGSLDGYYQRKDLNSLEKMVTDTEEMLFIKALSEEKSVIVDNTNLKPSYIEKWVQFVQAWNEDLPEEKQVKVFFKLFPEDNAAILKKRVNVRDAPLGWDKLNYIDKQVSSIRSAISYVEDNYKDQIL